MWPAHPDKTVTPLHEGHHTLRVEPDKALRIVERDPDDDMFLACAVAAKADAVISGDRHLLSLGCFRAIPILTPAELLDLWPEQRLP